MSNRIFFTLSHQDGPTRFYWARDQYDLSYIFRISPKGAFGAVLETIGTGDDAVLSALYTVNWEDGATYADEMKQRLQELANEVHESRLCVAVSEGVA